jgi:hypothetical protein
MNAVLRTMLEGVVDYAGLFPPAKLSMREAVAEYSQILSSSHSWLVDRFACTAERLDELGKELAADPPSNPVQLSVIGSPSLDREGWKRGIERDGELMTSFLRDSHGLAEIQAYEVKTPDQKHLEEYVRDLRQFTGVDVFTELGWTPELNDSLALLAEMETAFAKMRTGGLVKEAFPSSSQLAQLISQCCQLDLTFKLTAGLHHPLPHEVAETGARHHGFLNVLAACALAISEELSAKEIADILDETRPKEFHFRRDGISLHEHRASPEDVENSRTLLVSFGSCSVAEPVADLEKLGFLGKVSR